MLYNSRILSWLAYANLFEEYLQQIWTNLNAEPTVIRMLIVLCIT